MGEIMRFYSVYNPRVSCNGKCRIDNNPPPKNIVSHTKIFSEEEIAQYIKEKAKKRR